MRSNNGNGIKKKEASSRMPKAYNNTVNTAMEINFSSLIITSYNIIDVIKS